MIVKRALCTLVFLYDCLASGLVLSQNQLRYFQLSSKINDEPLKIQIKHCGITTKGICIKTEACPWDRILEEGDQEICTRNNNDFVCCQVKQILAPVDLFKAYDI